jgi:hypothetical protein
MSRRAPPQSPGHGRSTSLTCLSRVSRPAGFHHQPLSERCMRLSLETAPIRRTCQSCRSASERTGSLGPEPGAEFVSLEALVLPHRPRQERLIDVPEHGVQCRRRVPPVLVNPSFEERIDLPGDVGQRYLFAASDVQFPDRGPHRVQRRGTDRWREAANQLSAFRTPDRSWPELVSATAASTVMDSRHVRAACATSSPSASWSAK